LLKLRRLHDSHSGENTASLLIKLLNEYEITNRLRYFILDNAESNDIYVRTFLHYEHHEITEREIQKRRLRCQDHILNLAAKSFFFGKNADAFEME
jgi:hypothetical protein